MSSIRIERLESIPFSLPLAQPSKWGRWGARAAQDHVIVRLTDSDGYIGIAEATPRPTIYGETQHGVHRALLDLYAPIVEGQDPYGRISIRDRLSAIPWNLTARAAIDIAMHDLLARRAGVSLAEFLGGSRDPVPITYMLSVRSVEETVEEAQRISAAHGVRSFKVKLGGDAGKDRAVLERLRTDGAASWTLTVDGNELYGPESLHLLAGVLEDMDVALVEDPYRRTGLRRPRPAVDLPAPVMADEHMIDPEAVLRAADEPSVSVICIKPPRSGVIGSQAIRAIADASGMNTWIGSQGVSEVGAVASAHLSSAIMTSEVPADLGTFLRQESGATMLSGPLELVDGCITLPDGPGIGVDIAKDAIERFGVQE